MNTAAWSNSTKRWAEAGSSNRDTGATNRAKTQTKRRSGLETGQTALQILLPLGDANGSGTTSRLCAPCGPYEVRRPEYRDVKIADDKYLCNTILEIDVRLRRGVGYCKSMLGVVPPFERLRRRLRPARVDGAHTPTETSGTSGVRGEQWRTPGPTEPIFPK